MKQNSRPGPTAIKNWVWRNPDCNDTTPRHTSWGLVKISLRLFSMQPNRYHTTRHCFDSTHTPRGNASIALPMNLESAHSVRFMGSELTSTAMSKGTLPRRRSPPSTLASFARVNMSSMQAIVHVTCVWIARLQKHSANNADWAHLLAQFGSSALSPMISRAAEPGPGSTSGCRQRR